MRRKTKKAKKLCKLRKNILLVINKEIQKVINIANISCRFK